MAQGFRSGLIFWAKLLFTQSVKHRGNEQRSEIF